MALLPKKLETMSLDDDNDNVTAPTTKKGRKKTVEETYKKLTQLEHILLRPDTYIGSSQCMSQTIWVWSDENASMVLKEVNYPPGLYKIFDEILVNAADHAQRNAGMTMLKVEIEPENNRISVWNNGAGIPIEWHATYDMYVPELIFGNLLTSSNYDDEEEKVVGGRNGYGAKLANIFSTEFTVETASSKNGKKYKQVFRDNMNQTNEPQIRSGNKKEDWTKISFNPDLSKFDMMCLDDDIVSLMKKRVYDIAGCNPKIKVYLNGNKLPIKSFKDYVAFYTKDSPIYYERLNERWEVAIAPSDGQLTQVSFVNSICTLKGGTHVANVADQIATRLGEQIAKKDKKMKVRPFQIKNQLALYINCLITNPSFDSQTKETLTTKPSKFGSKWNFTDDFSKKVGKSTIIENILDFARFKQSKELAKTDGRKNQGRILGIPNLDDANKAGTRDASKCTLILTEGLSAKTLVVSAFSIIGRDYYGCFPLRGKLLNVREASHKQIMDNAEITNLKKILGLQQGKKYTQETIKTLRYGHVMIMTDQDHDGSHIKGLLLNFFDHFWPGLLQIPGFLLQFITPIVKTKTKNGKEKLLFYTQPEYKNWCDEDPTRSTKWTSTYLKGLGGSDAEDAKHYFSNLDRHQLTFQYGGDDDKKNIDLAFSKQRAEDRKHWLSRFVPGTFFNYSEDELTYSNFVNKELILFSMADNARSIPNVCDGLKPSQRKCLWSCFRKKCYADTKVNILCGYVTEHAAYHHGDASLNATIIGLAQSYVGSNNINLLHPGGQFGTRLQGGKDAASSRYISTRLTKSASTLFPALDNSILKYLEEEGKSIEPEWYCPVIPMILVNGSDGIGTGWSTSVPCFNPRDIIRNLRNMLRGNAPEPLHPWYRGFKGNIIPVGNSKSYDVHGTLLKCEEELTFKVKELPIGTWTSPYKEFLESNAIGHADAAKKPFIKDILDNGTETDVCFTFTTSEEGYSQLQSAGFYKKLKLTGSIATSNMVLFDSQGRLRRYADTNEILSEFFTVRLDLYHKRKAFLLKEMRQEALRLSNRARFITMVIAGKMKIGNRPKKELILDLRKKNFDQIFPKSEDTNEDSESEEAEEENNSGKGYDYLLSMALWSLTKEKVDKLLQDFEDKKEEIVVLEGTSAETLWEYDLKKVEEVMVENEKHTTKHEADLVKMSKAARVKQNAKGKGRKGKSKIKYMDISSDHDEPIPPPEARTITAKKIRKPKADTKPVKKTEVAKKEPKAPKTSVRRSILDSEDEEEDVAMKLEDDDSDDDFAVEEVLPKRASSNRRAAARAKVVLELDDEDVDDDMDDDEPFVVEKRASKSEGSSLQSTMLAIEADDESIDEVQPVKAAMKPQRKPKAKPTKIIDSEDEDSSDEESNMSLADRLAQRLAITSPESKDDSENEVRRTALSKKKPPAKPAGRKPPTTKRNLSKAKVTIVDSNSSTPEKTDDSTSSGAVKRPRGGRGTGISADAIGLSPSVARKVKRTRVNRKSPKKASPKRTNKRSVITEEVEENNDTTPSPAPAVRRRPQRARKAVVVISSDDEDVIDDDESDFEADDDDSDFE